MTESKSKLTKV